MGLLNRLKRTKKEKTIKNNPPTNLSEVIVQEMDKLAQLSPEELREYKRKQAIEQEQYEKRRAIEHVIVENHIKGNSLIDNGQIDEAIQCFEENVRLKTEAPYTYEHLAMLYHYKKEFEKERDIYKLYLSIDVKGEKADTCRLDFSKRLENVEQFLDNGKWKFDCLPSDPKILYYDIKEAKNLLNSDEPEKGVDMLEKIMRNGTYNNTVYNTLYQYYKKNKQFDDCIRVCEKAIEVLGFYSNDRKFRWNGYLEKSVKAKDKYNVT